MRTVRTGLYPIARLEKGAAVLAAAETVDVTIVKRRLDAFAAAHLIYTGAHGAVEAAEAQLRERQAVVNLCNAEQDQMIDRMARDRGCGLGENEVGGEVGEADVPKYFLEDCSLVHV
jgi:hypothetical protein